MFIAENITRQIKSHKLLNKCSLAFRSGRLLAVVGPNGAGKSTLLKVLSGECKDYNGDITVNGKPLKSYNSGLLARTRSVMSQHTVINFPYTVKEVVEVGRYMHKDPSAIKENILREVLEVTGLTSFKGRMYQSLSGGEKQRVQMARVMAQIWERTPVSRYLLLDEPTSSLDISQQQLLLSQAKKLCNRNIGVFAILHDLNLALQYADDILFMKAGNIMAWGETNEVVNKDIIEATFDHPVRLITHDQGITVIPEQQSFSFTTVPINQFTYG